MFHVAILVSSLLASGSRAWVPVGGACVRVFGAAFLVLAWSPSLRSLGAAVAASLLWSGLSALRLLGFLGLRLSCCFALAAAVRFRLVGVSRCRCSPFGSGAAGLGLLVAVAAFGGSGGGIAAAAAATGGLENISSNH